MQSNRIISILSLAIVLAMLASLFAGVMPNAGADIWNPDNGRNIEINDTNLDSISIYPGDLDINFWVEIENRGSGSDATDDNPIYECDVEISATVRDEDGHAMSPSPITWDDREAEDGATIYDWGSHYFTDFQFDVTADAIPGEYNLTVLISYENVTNVADTETCYISFEIEPRGDVDDMPDLIPGDKNKNIEITMTNHGTTMEDVTVSITKPDADFTWFGITGNVASYYYDGTIGMGSNEDFYYRLSVDADKDAGTYYGSYVLTYTNGDDVDCTETSVMEFEVGHLAMLTGSISTTTNTIAQGTNLVTWDLTFQNTGTVDLYACALTISEHSDDFTFMPADHWEDDKTVSYTWLELGDIPVGTTVTPSMEVGIDLYIPEGWHKIMFDFWGDYYDPDTGTYKQVSAGWVDADSYPGYEPQVNMDGGNVIHLSPMSSTETGTFAMVEVTDDTMDVDITSTVTLSMDDQIEDANLEVLVNNFGNIDYTNVVLHISTGTDSPFQNVIDSTSVWSEEAKYPGTLSGQTGKLVTLKVSLKPDATRGVYSIPVTIDAVNKDMGEVVSTTVNARITIRGVGPQLSITEVSPGSIDPGADFTLTMTVTNGGDDTARNVVVTMPTTAPAAVAGTVDPEINGDLVSPEGQAWPIHLADIAPGTSVQVQVKMKSNADMSSGHVYAVAVAINYVDSFGIGPTSSELSHQVAIKATGDGGSVLASYYGSLTFLYYVIGIMIIVFGIMFMLKAKKDRFTKTGGHHKEKRMPEPMADDEWEPEIDEDINAAMDESPPPPPGPGQ
jgi:hypothetical protein